jgi:hypothetical protein
MSKQEDIARYVYGLGAHPRVSRSTANGTGHSPEGPKVVGELLCQLQQMSTATTSAPGTIRFPNHGLGSPGIAPVRCRAVHMPWQKSPGLKYYMSVTPSYMIGLLHDTETVEKGRRRYSGLSEECSRTRRAMTAGLYLLVVRGGAAAAAPRV